MKHLIYSQKHDMNLNNCFYFFIFIYFIVSYRDAYLIFINICISCWFFCLFKKTRVLKLLVRDSFSFVCFNFSLLNTVWINVNIFWNLFI